MKRRILSIITALALCLGLLPTAALATGTHTHCICGKASTDTVNGHTHETSPTWEAWNTNHSLPTDGNKYYYLTTDVTLSSVWQPANGTFLCLNGHTIRLSGEGTAVSVGSRDSFTLTDCSNEETAGYIEGNLWKAGEVTNSETQTACFLTGGVITGATNVGVSVTGTFRMYGGNIAGNRTTANGGGVCVGDGGSFQMYGGEIVGNIAGERGGGISVGVDLGETDNYPKYKNSQFTMSGGTVRLNRQSEVTFNGGGGIFIGEKSSVALNGSAKVTENTATGYGGGIISRGTLTITGTADKNIVISENKSEYGGGIYMRVGELTASYCTISNNTALSGGGIDTQYTNAVVSMVNCSLTGNRATNGDGGGLDLSNKSTTLTNTTVSDNHAKGSGGGIYVWPGDSPGNHTLTITGGAVTNNTAASCGGGIHLENDSVLIMDGGTISGNTVSSGDCGGGVYVNGSYAEFMMSGDLKISDNTANSKANNLYVDNGAGKVTVGTADADGNTKYLTEGSQIGITHESIPSDETPVELTGGNNADYSKYFTSDNAAYGIYSGEENKVMLGIKKAITFDANGGKGTQEADTWLINSDYTLPECTYIPLDPENQKFKGWALTADGEVVGDTYTITKDTTFYAIWYDFTADIGGVTAQDGIYNGGTHTGYTGTPTSDFTGKYAVTYAGRNGTSYSSTIAPIDAGDYTVTIKVPDVMPEGSLYYTGSTSLDFSIAKADAEATAPTASNPIYDGTAQALVNAGETEDGTMQYALGSADAATGSWSTDIPTGTIAGTYYVWYKVVGDSNHNDSVPACVEVVIDKAWLDVTADELWAEVGDTCPTPTYTITGFVNGDTDSEINGTPVLTYSETPNMSETGYYTIEVNTEGISADNYDFNPIPGELSVVECVHTFTDFALGKTNVDNDSIFAICSKSCTEYSTPQAIVTIIAPDDPVYEPGLEHTASLILDDQIDLDSEDIAYNASPINAGEYTASTTYSGKTASVTYEVAKRALTVKVDNKSVYVNSSEPAYTYTVTGWGANYDAEDEFAPVLTGLTAVCENPDLTKTGSYEITISGTPTVTMKNIEEEQIDITANYEITTQTGTLTVSTRPSSGGGGGSSTTTTTEKNEDGSATTTTTNKVTGTVTETTKYPDGSTTTVETKKDGTITETSKTADGTTGTVVTDTKGNVTEVSAQVPSSAAKDAEENGEAVKLPIEVEAADTAGEAVEIDIDVPTGGAKVEIPIEDVTSGTVVIIVNKDGTEEIVKTSTITESGLVVTLDKDATIKVIDNSKYFVDVHPVNHWAEKAVDFVVARTIYSGTSENTFHPNTPMTRGMLAVVLHNLEDNPDHAFDDVFHDVAEGSWYEDAIHWAADKNIVSGYGNGLYGPNDNITREQLAVMLWRFAQYMGHDVSVGEDTNILSYHDAFEISEYAIPAMQWACGAGIMGGYGNGYLGPNDSATRAQVAVMLMNYLKSVQ